MALAPELVGLLASFALVCALMALSFGYTYTLGALLRGIANLLGALSIPTPFGNISLIPVLPALLTDLDNTIRNGLGTGIEYAQYGFNKVLQATAYTLQEIGNGIEALAGDTLGALDELRRVTIPGAIGLVFGPLAKLVYSLGQRVAALAAQAAEAAMHPGRILSHTIHTATTVYKTVYKTAYVTVPAAITKAVAIPGASIGWLEREATGLEKWVRAHAKDLTVAGIAGLVVGAIAREWPSLRCKNNKSAQKALCGLSPQTFEKILADFALGAVAIFGTIDLRTLATDYGKLIGAVSGEVTHFWRADVSRAPANPGLGDTGL